MADSPGKNRRSATGPNAASYAWRERPTAAARTTAPSQSRRPIAHASCSRAARRARACRARALEIWGLREIETV
ncbi:hypothetical protein X777_15180 [Ooceraea biroi]|uniref:Uncharacterized protein n=1 Tax=Ooceraea biroi TaxID=2015173 RepID=A0A026VWF5_OOCBI|nr:hypothetical protein X777_15180 [Ooceraea biroi]